MAIVAGAVASCELHNPGVSIPPAALSYPSALALSRESNGKARFLYVANSNFDLRYNSASLQAYDLDAIDRVMAASACRTYGTRTLSDDAGTRIFEDSTHYDALLDAGTPDASGNDDGGANDAGANDAGAPIASLDAGGTIAVPSANRLRSEYGSVRGFLCDDRDPVNADPAGPNYQNCCLDDSAKLDAVRKSELRIDSFAVGIAVSPDNQRLYVPVASKNQLVYVDVADGELNCGGDTYCRRGPGLHSPDNVPDDEFPGAVSEIALGTLSDLIAPDQANGLNVNQLFLATTHELGSVGLFVLQPDSSQPGGVGAPILDATLDGLGRRPRGITLDARRHVMYIASAQQSYISRIGARVNPNGVPGRMGPRELIYESTRIAVPGVSQSVDMRDVAPDPNDPSIIYVLIRGVQESIAFLQIDPTLEAQNARLIDEVRIGAGPSKMILIEQDGRSFLLVTCYDEKSMYIVDVASRELVSVVRGFSGPFTMLYDASRKLVHVSDFRASIMRVVDVASLTDVTLPPPRIVLTIGSAKYEGALQ